MVFGLNLFEHCKVKPQISLRHTALYPGNILEGVVILNVGAPVEYTAVRIKFCGKQRVNIIKVKHHTNQQTGERTTTREEFKESCCVYKQLITVAGTMKSQASGGFFGSSAPNLMMPPGQWTYPFALQLPTNIPPSFSKKVSDDFAEIVYFVKAYVDIPMGRDAVHRAYFTVVRPMPISQHMQKGPVSFEKTFDVTCCCCIDKGKVHARMFMDRTLIAIDRDYLHVCFVLDNSAGQEPIESLEVTLRHQLRYLAQGVRESNAYVAGKNFIQKRIEAGQKSDISGIIPINRQLVPSLFTTHIQSEYTITVEINIPNASDPSQTFNVIVAQTVDESNYSPIVCWNENKYQTLQKGQLSSPETFYMPPPSPVYHPQMLPFAPPPSAPVYGYNFQAPPIGLPSPMWQQQALPMVGGAPAMIQPLGTQWSGGYEQRPVADTTMPPPPLGAIIPTGGPMSPGGPPPPMMMQQQQPYGSPPPQHPPPHDLSEPLL